MQKTGGIIKEKNIKISKFLLITLLVMVFLLVFVTIWSNYWCKKEVSSTVKTEQTNVVEEPDNSGKEEDVKENEKSKDNTLSALNTAIENNPQEVDNYIKKSEVQYSGGDKEGALETVEEGLQIDPDNELLKSRKDTLEKEFFQINDELGDRN